MSSEKSYSANAYTLAQMIAGALRQMPGTTAQAIEGPSRDLASIAVNSQELDRIHYFDVQVRGPQ
jgi:hypothetical protein